MPVDPKLATEVAKVVAKEVYGDAFAPATREIGIALGDLARTMRIAGLEFGAITRERVVEVVGRALQRVPIERRMLPPPQVLGPVLEGMRYEPDGSSIAEMFEELLSRSMDSSCAYEAHPAFANLIRQLSPDEVKLLRLMNSEKIKVYELYRSASYTVGSAVRALVDPGIIDLPEQAAFYLDHLRSLGLVEYHINALIEGDESCRDFPSGEKERVVWAGLSQVGRRLVEATSKRS